MYIHERLQLVFGQLNANNIDLFDKVYANNIQFEDPAHKLDGLLNFKSYCRNLYQNIISCTFSFKNT